MVIAEHLGVIRVAGGAQVSTVLHRPRAAPARGRRGEAKGGDGMGQVGVDTLLSELRQPKHSHSLPAARQTTQLHGDTFFNITFHNKCCKKYCSVLELPVLTELRPLRSISTTIDWLLVPKL